MQPRLTNALALAAILSSLAACNGGSSPPAVAAPAGLTYGAAEAVYPVGTAITPNAPASTGGPVASYAVVPALPAGLGLDLATGVISGTPIAAAAEAVYVVTATNAAGHASVELLITVRAPAASPVRLDSLTATMDPGAQRVFAATVDGFADQSVTWTTTPAGVGALLALDGSSVAFTAPAAGGQVTLTATSVADPSASASVTIEVRDAPAPLEDVFNNGNVGGVQSGPTSPTTFTLAVARHAVSFDTYHYFNGGALPGLLGLRHADGTEYGPWQATGGVGQGGVQNASWICHPEVELPAGSYAVLDSGAATWSYNDESGGAGFAHLVALALP